jgi:hypothetical protein
MSSSNVKGWRLVPAELTAENGMKAALMGEFQVSITEWDEAGNEYIRKIDVPWHTIKRIHHAIVAVAPTPPVPVLQLETHLSDRDVKALHGYLAQAGAVTPPAQEDEPICQMSYDGVKWIDIPEESFKTWNPGGSNPLRRKLYPSPQSADELRKAADRLLNAVVNDAVMRNVLDTEFWDAADNLRAELERQL